MPATRTAGRSSVRLRATARAIPLRHPQFAEAGFIGSRFGAPPPSLRPGQTSNAIAEPALPEVSCAVYSDARLLANALIALGSFKLFSPGMRCTLFLKGPADFGWLRGVTVVDIDDALRASFVDVASWSRLHHDAIGHYFRKAAVWLYLLDPSRSGPSELHTLIDADVIFVRPTLPMWRHVSNHAFAAMVEAWHPSVWSIFERQSPGTRRQAEQLFHGTITEEKMRRTPYFNAGFLLARPDDAVHEAVKDVLAASVFYPSLSRDITCAEQTLLNLALIARGIPCRDLYGLCVPSYHDEARGWPEPVARHFLGDQVSRVPSFLRVRYPRIVDQSLAAVGVDVAELEARGLWS